MQRMALLDEAIGVATRLRAYAQGRFNAGQATASDVDRAEIELLHAQSKREPLQALLHRHLKRLAVLTGRTPQSIQVLPLSSVTLTAPPLPHRLPGQVLERRPDVRARPTSCARRPASSGRPRPSCSRSSTWGSAP